MAKDTITIELTWRGVIAILILVFVVIPLLIVALKNPALTILMLPIAFFLVILAAALIPAGLIVLIIKIAQKLKLIE